MQTVTVQVNKRIKEELEPRHAEFEWEYPETVQEAIEKYGESLTLKLINDSITLDVQAPARKILESAPGALSGEEYSSLVSNAMSTHKIEVKRTRGASGPRVSTYQQMARDLADPAARDAIIAKFRSLGINLEAEKIETNEVALEPNPTEASSVERRRR